MRSARDLPNETQKSQALAEIASDLLDKGRTDEARSVSYEALGAAEEVDEEGRTDEALNLTREALAAVEQIKAEGDETPSQAFAGVATAQASLGPFREARMTARRCKLSQHELTSYSAILLEYAKRQDPALAKALEAKVEDDLRLGLYNLR